MAAPKPEIKRQAGTPNQLPMGEAQAANEAIAQAEQAQEQQAAPEAPQPAPPPPETQGAIQPPSASPGAPTGQTGPNDTGVVPVFRPSTDEEKFLFGPTERPNEPITAGMNPMSRMAAPADVIDALPALQRAALIAPQLRYILNLTMFEMMGR
jgi:hypothetical protein